MDVAVIGAGPAGCLAAIELARQGLEVVLIEQQRFPRDKVCGEMLSDLGRQVLGRAEVWGLIHSAGAVEISRASIFAPDGSGANLLLPRPMWGISRWTMDALLLDQAKHAGVRVLQPARCEQVRAGRPVKLRIRELQNNRQQSLEAKFALVADGKGAAGLDRPAATGDLGIKAHFESVDGPADTVELFGVRGHYIGLGAVEDRRWNLAMSVPAWRVRELSGDVDILLKQCLEENPVLHRRLKPARRVSDWKVSPLPRFAVQPHWPEGVIPMGNAAAALEPIGGEGMGLALRSAELATAAVKRCLQHSGAFDPAQLRREYQNLWMFRRTACRAAGMVVSRPLVCGAAASLLRGNALLAEIVLRAAGKTMDIRTKRGHPEYSITAVDHS